MYHSVRIEGRYINKNIISIKILLKDTMEIIEEQFINQNNMSIVKPMTKVEGVLLGNRKIGLTRYTFRKQHVRDCVSKG